MKRKWIVMVVALFVILSVFAACGTDTDDSKNNGSESTAEYVYEISGVKDAELTVNDADYDFMHGVTGKRNGESETVKVDTSKVKFGQAGIYDIVYTCGTENKYAKVYIYTADRKPVIKAENVTISYAEALRENSILTGVTATDELGRDIAVKVTKDYEKTGYGLIRTGEHEVSYSVGEGENVKTATRKITVNAGDLPTIAAQTTDLKKPEISFNVEGGVFLGIYSSNGEAGEDDYILNNNVLTLVGDYIAAFGEGEHELCVLFENGYVNVKITVTDNEDMVYTVENLFDMNNYIVGDEVVFAKGVRGEFSKQNIVFSYKLDGEAVTESEKVFNEAGEHTFEITAVRGETSETKTYDFKVLTAEDYYKQNFVNEQNVNLWVSMNNDAVAYVQSEGETPAYFVLKHTSNREGNERCFYIKDLIPNAVAAGMNELYVKYYSDGAPLIWIDAYELESANYYDSPWGGQPWNMVSPMYNGAAATSIKELKLVLDDAYAPASSTGNLMMFAKDPNVALNVTEISFGKADHTVAYKESYENKNVISASVTIKGGLDVQDIEFYITDKVASVKGARAGFGLVLHNNMTKWDGWIGINAYSQNPINNFHISRVLDMGPGEAGEGDTNNGKKGCVSPLNDGQYNDRAGYYNEDGSKTFTVKFIPDYATNNTYIEFYFGTEKFFTVTPTNAEEMKQIITSGTVVVLVNGEPVAAEFITDFKVSAKSENFYTAEGIDDVNLSVDQTEYDFYNGVKVMCNGEEVDFSCDAAEVVQFGIVGEYEVTYSAGTFKRTIKVIVRAFEVSGSTTLSVMGRKTTLGTVTKVYAQEGRDYEITYTLNGETVDIETLKDGDKYAKVFDQPGKYVWMISVKIGDLEAVTTSETINVVTTTEKLNETEKVNDLNKITIEFTINDSTTLESLEVYIGTKTKLVENARKASVGLQFNISGVNGNMNKDQNKLTMEGYDNKGNQGDVDFKFLKAVDNMGGTTNQEVSSGQAIWAASLLSHGAYNEYYGGESVTKRNMKFVFTKLETGYAQIEFFLGNTETGEYVKMFTTWVEAGMGADSDNARFKWPAAKSNVFASIVVNGSVEANEHISNYKVTAEKA